MTQATTSRPPPVGSRYAERTRADGIVICIHRTEARFYEIEQRSQDGTWGSLPLRAEAISHAEAMALVEEIAVCASDAHWFAPDTYTFEPVDSFEMRQMGQARRATKH
jgi:hypothetical protein